MCVKFLYLRLAKDGTGVSEGSLAKLVNYFCPRDCSRAAIVVWSKMRTGFCARAHKSLIRFVRSTTNKKRTPRDLPGRFPVGTKFAEEFPCKHGTSYRRICEPDPTQRGCVVPVRWSGGNIKKSQHPFGCCDFLEAPPGIGPGIEVLQTFALPLGHGAIFT